MKRQTKDKVQPLHAGGPVESRDQNTGRNGASAATNCRRPFAHCEQRVISACATRTMKSATDSSTAGCGGGIADSAVDPSEFVQTVRGGNDARRMGFERLRARNGDDPGGRRERSGDTPMWRV